MPYVRRFAAMLMITASLAPGRGSPWGHDGHALVLERALSMLPENERRFYDGGRPELERWMAEPDRHHRLPAESSRHWLDLEKLDPAYISLVASAASRACGNEECADEHLRDLAAEVDAGYFGAAPAPWRDELVAPLWSSLPATLRELESSYGQLTLVIGTVVYQPALYAAALARSRAAADQRGAAKYAGLLAHYAADAFEPFHLTAAYRGQYSGNLYFRHEERGDAHARFETGFVLARREELKAALFSNRDRTVSLEMASITPEIMAAGRRAYALLPVLLETDRAACDRADPRRKWDAYLREVSPAFMEIAARQMAGASRLLANILLAARPVENSAPDGLSGKMDSP